MQVFELVELDPETGEEDQLLATGSMRRMIAHMNEIIEDMSVDYDYDGPSVWSWLRVQPAT